MVNFSTIWTSIFISASFVEKTYPQYIALGPLLKLSESISMVLFLDFCFVDLYIHLKGMLSYYLVCVL